MLGHIFENLLEENKEKGAFYTPKEIVHFMCQESLVEYLTTHLEKEYTVYKELNDNQVQLFGNDAKKGQLSMMEELGDKALNRTDVEQIVKEKNIAGLSEEQQDRISDLLDRVKVCDPAIGSGAFPMGILQEIFSIKEIIAYERNHTWNPAEVKENIIQNSVYGVDIERGAVDIARLRFWLSLLVDSETPQPLPNLEYKIVVGNSLLSKFEGQPLEIEWNIKGSNEYEKKIISIADELTQKQKDFFETTTRKFELQREIRRLKIELIEAQIALNKRKFEENAVSDTNLFGPTNNDKKQAAANTAHLAELNGTQQRLQKLKQNESIPLDYFDWNLDFPEILNPHLNKQPGFDIVIANPPYMRVQEIQKSMPEDKKLLEKKFSNAKASYDLANLFFEMAVNLGKPNSSNCFIFPHKFFNSAAAKVFRDYLFEGKYVDKIAHFGANMVFNEADTYTCITFFSPKPNDGFWFQKFALGTDYLTLMKDEGRYNFVTYDKLQEASRLYGSNQWILFNTEAEYDIFIKIYNDNRRIKDSFEDIFQGIATSKDSLYVVNVVDSDDKHYYGYIFNGQQYITVEKRFFKPLLRGDDVHRYAKLETDKYVFFPYKISNGEASIVELDELEANYPKTYAYIMENEKEFKKRESGKAGKMDYWYTYIYPKNLTKFEQEKLSSMEICTSFPNVTLNDKNFYHNTKVYSWVKKSGTQESYEYFLAIANSNLIWWFLKNTGDTLRGDARTFKSDYLNPFPLPTNVNPETDRQISAKVREVMEAKEGGEDTYELEKEIDAMVYQLYGLTEEEVGVIEGEVEVGVT